MKRSIRGGTLVAGVAAIAFAVSACGGEEPAASNPGANQAPTTTTTMQQPTTTMADPAANLVGPGCADYAKAVPDGDGSVSGMAQDPVAVAASNNPLLKTLVAAVSGKLNPKVDLVDTLNGGEFTVFAPVDSAFAKIDAATIEKLKKDDALLSTILTYHVVPGRIAPDQIVGTQTTVQKGTVEVTGSGNSLKVNDANVICGGVSTANATVYLIDSVLMPKM